MEPHIQAPLACYRHPQCTLPHNPWNGKKHKNYFLRRAKTVSEWEAWAIAAQQRRWSLVVICPANILGPPVAASAGTESVATAKKLLDGSIYPFVPPLGALG